MVQLACSCLNIRLHVQESPESLVPGIPNLSPSEKQHPFFLKGACPVTLGLGGITEGQRLLVRRCRVGGWTVLECLNCHLLTHATRGHGGDVAASTLLISDATKIQMLQKCDGYSPVFNLVLPTSPDTQSPPPPLSPTSDFPGERSPETEAALSEVQQQLTRFLKKAQAQVEANIEAYRKQQQAALQALTVRARRDRQTVMQLISNMQANMQSHSDDDMLGFEMEGAARGGQQQLRPSVAFSPTVQTREADEGYGDDVTGLPDDPSAGLPSLIRAPAPRGSTQPMSMSSTQGITAGMHNMRLSSSMAVPRAKQQHGVGRVAQSFDAEGLFDMEGMMESNTMPSQPPAYQSDDDDDDETDDLSRGGMGGHDSIRDLAKSVPVSVPMWPAARPKPMPDDHVVERPSDIQQMAASIKALARSVHTTSVDLFGDLPRPRQPL